MNSLSEDARFRPSASVGGGGSGGGNLFAEARTVLTNHCASCHGSWLSYSEPQWISSGLVVAGKPGSSPLVTRMRGSGGNMPPTGPIGTAEESKIASWISAIGRVDPPGGGTTSYAEQARQILSANCASCHGSAVTATSAYWSGNTVPPFGGALSSVSAMNSYMRSTGLVSIAADPQSSWIYLSLRGHGVSGWVDGTMPKTPNSALSSSNVETIRLWILSM